MGVSNCKPNPAKTNHPPSEERLCFLHALEKPRSRSICDCERKREHEHEPTDRQQLPPTMSVDGGSCFGVVKVEKLQSENALNAISGGRRSLCESLMSELVARTGRHLQRYNDGCRLLAGCIPFKYRSYVENGKGTYEKVVEVLMVSSTSGPGLVFPKGGWENDETVEQAAVREAIEEAGVRGELMQFLGYYSFNKSKRMQDEICPQGVCKAAMFMLLVKEELQAWPEQSSRQRSWLTIPEATECCRHPWMRKALEEGFSKWHVDQMISKPQIKE